MVFTSAFLIYVVRSSTIVDLIPSFLLSFQVLSTSLVIIFVSKLPMRWDAVMMLEKNRSNVKITERVIIQPPCFSSNCCYCYPLPHHPWWCCRVYIWDTVVPLMLLSSAPDFLPSIICYPRFSNIAFERRTRIIFSSRQLRSSSWWWLLRQESGISSNVHNNRWPGTDDDRTVYYAEDKRRRRAPESATIYVGNRYTVFNGLKNHENELSMYGQPFKQNLYTVFALWIWTGRLFRAVVLL